MTHASDARADEAVTWRWESPAVGRVVGWPEPSAAARELDMSAPIEIGSAGITLVPIDAGDQLHLDGHPVHVGFGAGTSDEYPDVITWTARPVTGVLRVPTWSSARFVALRAEVPAALTVATATRIEDPLRDRRLDRAVYDWLRDAARSQPPRASHDERRTLAALAALRSVVPAAPAPELDAIALWLHGSWLERRLSRRRLVEPFFVSVPSAVAGGQSVTELDAGTDAEDWRALSAGQELSVTAEDADVISVAARVRAQGQSRLQIWSGDVLVEDLVWHIPRRAETVSRWTPARVSRIVPRGERPLRVVAVEGAVRVRAEARRTQRSLLDPAVAHHRAALQAQEPELATTPWLQELLEYHFRGGGRALAALERRLTAGDTAPSARLLLAYEALPALVARPAFGALLAAFWKDTQALAISERSSVQSALLERLLATLPEPIAASRVDDLGIDLSLDGETTSGVRDVLLEASIESVFAVEDAARPVALHALELAASRNSDDARLVELAREAWSRAAPWTALGAPGAAERTLARRPFDGNQPSGMCDNQGARGTRWWILPERPTAVDVLDLGGTHSAVRLLPMSPDALQPAEVMVDDQVVRVQPAFGEASLVAVRPGRHYVRHVTGERVIARIPRAGASPCEQLVEMERWFELRGELGFVLPPGPVPTVGSVIVDPSSVPAQGAILRVSAGGESVVAWVRRPASGDIEIVVPAGATELRVSSDRALLVRARVRLHPAPDRETVADIVRTGLGPQAIFELPRLTAGLRASSNDAERAALRHRRADLLHELGYSELASVEWSRAGKPELAGLRSMSGALFLPERREAVVPLGVAARAPLFPLAEPATVERALAYERAGQMQRALAELTPAADARQDAAPLFAARLAANAGEAAIAAKIFERLALETNNAGLLEAAAESYDRLALETRRRGDAERAFILAKLAVRAGADLGGLLARYGDAIEWRTPSLSALGIGTMNVERPATDLNAESLGARVRRALTLAPADARQFTARTGFNVRRWRGSQIIVESSCFNREGPLEGCAAEVLVDEVVVPCTSPEPPAEVASPRACAVALSEDAMELTVRLPAGARRMGWARLHEGAPQDGGAELRPVKWQQTYSVLTSDVPIRLDVTGPAVLRLDARALGSGGAALEVFDQPRLREPPPTSSAPFPTASLVFGNEPGRAAGVTPAGEAISEPLQLEVIITADGAREITLTASSGRLLVRPELASVVRTPEPEPESLEQLAEPMPAGALVSVPGSDAGVTAVAAPRRTYPLSLSAEASVRDRDLAEADADGADRYAEAALVLRRALWDEALWMDAGAFARFRAGPPSVGAEISGVASPMGFRPGAFAGLRAVAQPGLDAVGAITTMGVRHRVPVGRRASLLPELSATWRGVTRAVSVEPDADGDVYSLYAWQRPWSVDAKTTLVQRPLLDVFGRHSLGMRFNLGPVSVDRIDVRSDFDLLGGAGFTPWLGVELSGSHRPSSTLRSEPFTRWQVAPQVTFWHWLGASSRLRSTASLSLFVDTPNPTGTRAGVFASWAVAYDFLLGDGLRDFRTSERLFRARLEEGGPPARSRAPVDDVYWREAQAP